ncbi:MAG: phosphoglucosamine mutase [Acidobacteriota bacterium]
MKLFGTDGIRGRAGSPPLEPETVARVGAALARAAAARGAALSRVLVGRDTRESGPWIEAELARGLASHGARVTSAGVIPTPAVAYLTRALGFDAGIVISASHNPYEDNGIKVFSGAGEKLSEALEASVEAAVADPAWSIPPGAHADIEPADLRRPYEDHLERILADAGPLTGSRIVIDCANGATTTIAPELFAELGFDVVPVAVEPNGRNINLDCGSTHLGGLRDAVRVRNARLGVAFDGDGDRALLVDHRGEVVDGDALLFITGLQLKAEGRLPGDAIVATVMSNIGLELALKARGIALVRCPVGDKYVMEEMQRRGLALGGEQSGHVIFADHLSTGDGIGTALQALRVMAVTGRELADLSAELVTYPQVLVNVRVKARTDFRANPAIADAIARLESRLDGHGRLLVRYSGTEPLLRIMLEGRDQQEIQAWARELADTVKAHLG